MADFHSRCFKDNTEWTLDYAVFQSICHIYSLPLIDLFASCHTKQLDKYVSWYPDPHAWAVDAFSIPWHTLLFYVFPPFSLVARVLKKINREEATGILVVLKLTTQAWLPVLLSILISHPREIRPHTVTHASPGTGLLPSTPQEASPFSSAFIRDMLQSFGISAQATELICHSWRPSTRIQYNSILRRWGGFCAGRQIHPSAPSLPQLNSVQ